MPKTLLPGSIEETSLYSDTMIEYLKTYREDMPQWLKDYKSGDFVPFTEFMAGRVGYYPGSYTDGTLIKVGNMSQSVHCFIQVDYWMERDYLNRHLAMPRCVYGYHEIGRVEWTREDILPRGEYPSLEIARRCPKDWYDRENPYYFLVIFERDKDRDDSWGAERFAVAFFMTDAIAMYNSLFVHEYRKAPWILLLQDHGLGGNYDRFGRGGILDRIIRSSSMRPEFIILGHSTVLWEGYERVQGTRKVRGGMHEDWRSLYKLATICEK